MARIKLTSTPMDMLIALGEGNPGALTVMMSLMEEMPKIDTLDFAGPYSSLLAFDELEIYGSQIWILYKDVCGESIVHLIAALRGWQLGIVSQTNLKQGNFSPALVLEQVIERLGANNFIVPEKVM